VELFDFGSTGVILVILFSKPVFFLCALVLILLNTGRARRRRGLPDESPDLLSYDASSSPGASRPTSPETD
jgi:hypothetical protein